MKSFKKVVSIILVISIIASIFAISASAVYGTVQESVLQNGWLAHKVGNNSMLYQFEKDADVGLNFIQAVGGGNGFVDWASTFFPNATSQEYNSIANSYFYITGSGLLQHFSFYNFGLNRYGYEALPQVAGISAQGMEIYQWDSTEFMKGNEDFKLTYKGLCSYCNLLQKSGFSCYVTTIIIRQYDASTVSYEPKKCYVIKFNGNVSAGNVGGRPEYDGVFACDDLGYIYFVDVNELEGTIDTGRNNYTAPSSGGDQYILDVDPHYEPTININDDDTLTYYDSLLGLDVFISELSYNPETNNYSLSLSYTDSSTHITNNYDIRYEYYIDYTSVTYIGQSAEYDKTYKIYYELPDGRSSADLTAEELEQLSLEFDVINYGKSADDGRLRALYHFDGNTEDSSYYVAESSFDWSLNPSISYLESPNFEGCLYLDERGHTFTITLPSNLASGDFSILWRYYHSANANPATDLTVKSGSTTLKALTTGATTAASDTPLGTWSEVALIRDGANLRFYVNGLQVSNSQFTTVLGNTITFDFANVPVYRYFDELRVFSYAYAQAGASYTPITVPQTTNAVLVLPDEPVPIPDPYWDFNTDGNLLPFYDFTQGVQYPVISSSSLSFVSSSQIKSQLGPGFLPFGFVPYSSSVSLQPSFLTLSNSNLSYPSSFYFSYDDFYSITFSSRCFFIPIDLMHYYRSFGSSTPTFYHVLDLGVDNGKLYTFSLLDSSGKQYSFSFTHLDPLSTNSSFTEFGPAQYYTSYSPEGFSSAQDVYFTYVSASNQHLYNGTSGIFIYPKHDIDVVYMELKEGTIPNDNTHAFKTMIYPETDVERHTIAVRSLIPVRSSRIGGVRPTLPYRGDVWCQVQNGYITSCQIYTGFVWQEVDCRIWTGSRWVWPLYYNVQTMQDQFDISGTTDTVYIQDDSGYYSWITRQWASLLDLLNTISDKLSGVGGGNTEVDLNFTIGELTLNIKDESDSVVKLLIEFLGTLKDLIFDGVFDSFTDNMDDFKSVFDSGGDTIDGDPSAFSILESGDVWV